MLLELLPSPFKQRIRKAYYPRLLRRFSEEQWDCAEAARCFIGEGDTVVDAGANVGYVTMLFSKWVGPSGRVVSFEPVPETFDLLQTNLRKLGLSNVTADPCGVSSQDGTATFAIPKYPWGGENLYESRVVGGEEPVGPVREVEVQLRQLDTVLADRLDSVAFVKLDVEGHELEAVRGGSRLIAATHPPLLIEVSGDPDDSTSRAARLFLFLKEAGYDAYVYEEGQWRQRVAGDRCVDYFFLTPAQAASTATRS